MTDTLCQKCLGRKDLFVHFMLQFALHAENSWGLRLLRNASKYNVLPHVWTAQDRYDLCR